MNRFSGQPRSNQAGLTLPEVLVAMLLGLFITAGGISLFVTNKVVYTDAARLTELHENAHFAQQYLLDDLRHAYFFGGVTKSSDAIDFDSNTLTNTAVAQNCAHPAAAFGERYLFGASATGGSAIGCIEDAARVNGIPSDVLVLKRLASRPIVDMGSLIAGDMGSLIAGNVYVAANRLTAIVFQAKEAVDVPLVSTPCDPERRCVPYGAYWRYVFHAYYVRDADPLDAAPPTLARKTLEWDDTNGMSMVTENLVEGVEGMRILYGARTVNDALFYTDANGVTDWEDIAAVRVHLLVRTLAPEPSHDDEATYVLGDTEVDFADANFATSLSQGAQLRNFHRRVVSATVMLRNKSIIDQTEQQP